MPAVVIEVNSEAQVPLIEGVGVPERPLLILNPLVESGLVVELLEPGLAMVTSDLVAEDLSQLSLDTSAESCLEVKDAGGEGTKEGGL